MVQLPLLKGADKDEMDNNEWPRLCVAADFGGVNAALALFVLVVRKSALGAAITRNRRYTFRLQKGARGGGRRWRRGPTHSTSFCRAFNRTEAIDVLVEAGASIEASTM